MSNFSLSHSVFYSVEKLYVVLKLASAVWKRLLIDWMVFYAAFNSISVISRRQLTLFMSSWVSPVLGWGSEVSCPRTLPRKNQRIQCDSNQGPLDYKSNTLPLSHAGPPWKSLKFILDAISSHHTINTYSAGLTYWTILNRKSSQKIAISRSFQP